mgnify:CR=1 FL=1
MMQLPAYIKVDPTSKTGLRYSENRGKRRAGDEAGWLSECGYWRVSFGGRTYLNHRLVWQHYFGAIPAGLDVEHADRNRQNCCASNLRLATRGQNNQNIAGHVDSALGIKGVSPTKDGYFHAHVTVNRQRHTKKFVHLGDAIEWVRAKREEVHDERFLRHS